MSEEKALTELIEMTVKAVVNAVPVGTVIDFDLEPIPGNRIQFRVEKNE